MRIRNLLPLCLATTLLLTGAGCTAGPPIEAAIDDVKSADLLFAMEEAGIPFSSRNETEHAYDLRREDAERYLYRLEPGNITMYVFSTASRRREVQRNPFPAAGAEPPNGSYGMGGILVFYYDGDQRTALTLAEAFEPLGAESTVERGSLRPETEPARPLPFPQYA